MREKIFSLFIGLCLLALFAFLFYWSPPFVQKTTFFLERSLYDLKLRYFFRPLDKQTPIAIVDIDDKSLAAVGRWPWSRKKLAALATKLYENGATVVAFDIIFSEPETNLIQAVVEGLKEQKRPLIAELTDLEPLFDNDRLFANALEKGESVLAFTLNRSRASHGLLPPPVFSLSQKLTLPNFPNYLSNIPILQQAARGGGSINATPDSDGVIRSSPLLLLHDNGLYPSLALQAAMLYLLEDKIELIVQNYREGAVLEKVQLGKIAIPVDSFGKVLIPFRGPPYSFPRLSAADLLEGKVSRDQIANKLLFVGSSATGMGDLFPTAIAPVFAGVEIHASIAAGILDRYFPYNPTWGKGVSLALTLALGLICAFCFPFFGAISNTFLFFLFSGGLFAWDLWIWKTEAISFSVIEPVFTLFVLFLFHEIFGYSSETRKRKELKDVFGQYLSPQYLEKVIKAGKTFDLMGENKELTVFFSDIRGFTSLSEKFTAPELKAFLNQYFTPMTQILFDHRGTIDKYVGDMIMAFWGAPMPDPEHARHAIESALAMQKKLQELNLGIQIGIGINTGLMNVGDMGSKFRRAYTVLGDAVNLASRLESLTKMYHVGMIVGEETKKKTEANYTFRFLDKVQVKGKAKAVAIYEPICKKEEISAALQKELAQHEEAFQAYQQKQWDKADRLFQALSPSNPELYALYQARIQTFRKSPPPPEWDGVHVLDTK